MVINEFDLQNKKIDDFLDQPYKYGFQTEIEKEDFPCGLNIEIIKEITKKKK